MNIDKINSQTMQQNQLFINKLKPAIEPISGSIQSGIQLILDDTVQQQAGELYLQSVKQQQIINSLPSQLQSAVKHLFEQAFSPSGNNIEQGLATYVKNQKLASSAIFLLANLYEEAVNLRPQIKELSPSLLFLAEKLYTKLAKDTKQPFLDLFMLTGKEADNIASTSNLLKQLLEGSYDYFLAGSNRLFANQAQTNNQLLFQFMKNIPQHMLQLAQAQNQPELPDVWVLLKIHELVILQESNVSICRQNSQKLHELGRIIEKSLILNGQSNTNSLNVNFLGTVYLGNPLNPYPLYIHIYHERNDKMSDSGQSEPETWLHMYFSTEKIGDVDLIFRLYRKNHLTLRIRFAAEELAQIFSLYIPHLRQEFEKLALILDDVQVS